MSHIFISYSKQNRDYITRLESDLRLKGFDVWVDDVIEPGEDWWRNIRQAIKDSSAVIIIMTPEAENSHWVSLEVLHALEYKKPIFPLLLSGDENIMSSDSWSRLAIYQVTDVRNSSVPAERFYARLAQYAPTRPMPIPAPRPQEKPKLATTGMLNEASLQRVSKPAAKLPAPPEVYGVLKPPFEWCLIPAGQTTIEYSSMDKRTFDLAAFYMAKYPITNAQYQAFVDAPDGYRNEEWWQYSEPAKQWRKKNAKPQDTAFPGNDLPRTNVTWYESVAFCRWLTACLSWGKVPLQIALPTEQQWQRAAQGDDGRMYPWGNNYDKNRCNTKDVGLSKPTSVTRYTGGASPFGVMDMSGNTWEWCLTKYMSKEDVMDGTSTRMARGGGYSSGAGKAKNASRGFDYLPFYKSDGLGFRIIACRVD